MIKPAKRKKPSPPKLTDTHDLCLELAALAGLVEQRRVQEKIYQAVRQLRLLDQVAREAGLIRDEWCSEYVALRDTRVKQGCCRKDDGQ